MNSDFWYRFKHGDIAIRFNTNGETKEFLELCEERDCVWGDGSYPREFNPFPIHKNYTYIRVLCGQLVCGNINFLIPNGIAISKFSDLKGNL